MEIVKSGAFGYVPLSPEDVKSFKLPKPSKADLDFLEAAMEAIRNGRATPAKPEPGQGNNKT